MRKGNILSALISSLALLLVACQQEASTNAIKQTSAMVLGNGKIVGIDCVRSAATTGSDPSGACTALNPTQNNSQVAAQLGLNTETGLYMPYGWFNYYSQYPNVVYYYDPTVYSNLGSYFGYAGYNFNNWLGWNDSYNPLYYNFNTYLPTTASSYLTWYQLLGPRGGWYWWL